MSLKKSKNPAAEKLWTLGLLSCSGFCFELFCVAAGRLSQPRHQHMLMRGTSVCPATQTAGNIGDASETTDTCTSLKRVFSCVQYFE